MKTKTFSDEFGNQIILCTTPWDTVVLNKRSCDLKIVHSGDVERFNTLFEEVDLYTTENGYEFIQARFDSNDKDVRRIFQKLGYYIAEISYSMSLTNPSKLDVLSLNRIDVELVPLTSDCKSDLETIKRIAHDDFHHGRMIEDININESLARKRSANWIDDLVNEPFSLYKAMFRGRLIGFHAERLNNEGNSVDWILTGVGSKYSVYALPLWCAALKLAQNNKIDIISTMISASNTKVLNLYNRFPFRIDGSLYGYHKLRG